MSAGKRAWLPEESRAVFQGGLMGAIMRSANDFLDKPTAVEPRVDGEGDYQPWFTVPLKSGHTVVVTVSILEGADD